VSAARPDQAGYDLPVVTITPDPVQLFSFSAVTWNLHRIHYDAPFATEVEHHTSVIVQGPLLGAWILQAAQSWVKGWGVIRSCHYRNLSPAYVEDVLTLSGTVVSDCDHLGAMITIAKAPGTEVCRGEVVAYRMAVSKVSRTIIDQREEVQWVPSSWSSST
jgi:hydroxyacyl-ACP dehydratase HTD2-like protein with hotdog domain